MPKIVTFGEIMLRLAPPNLERILQTGAFVATFGGGEANVAVAVAGSNDGIVDWDIAHDRMYASERALQILDLDSIPREIVVIMQAIILLSVVIAYEIVQHIGQTQETKSAAEATRRMDHDIEPAAGFVTNLLLCKIDVDEALAIGATVLIEVEQHPFAWTN